MLYMQQLVLKLLTDSGGFSCVVFLEDFLGFSLECLSLC